MHDFVGQNERGNNAEMLRQMPLLLRLCGERSSMVERLVGVQVIGGSIPLARPKSSTPLSVSADSGVNPSAVEARTQTLINCRASSCQSQGADNDMPQLQNSMQEIRKDAQGATAIPLLPMLQDLL